jgi:type VI secretion system protein ImpF
MASTISRQALGGVSSLLDRLTERPSGSSSDATHARGELPEPNLRQALLRDLGWLLNTSATTSVSDFSNRPNIRRSVLNYGVRVATGRILDNSDLPNVALSIRRAIELFEPRLRRETLSVRIVSNEGGRDLNKFQVIIDGEYVDHGVWMPLTMLASLDAETGGMEIASDSVAESV